MVKMKKNVKRYVYKPRKAWRFKRKAFFSPKNGETLTQYNSNLPSGTGSRARTMARIDPMSKRGDLNYATPSTCACAAQQSIHHMEDRGPVKIRARRHI